MIKKIPTLSGRALVAVLLISTFIISLLAFTACTKEEERDWPYTYDPYFNNLKDDVPIRKVRVKGNAYLFSEIMVRDKDNVLDVTAQNSLAILYETVFVEFTDEETVEIVDYSGFFKMPPTKGERDGNILTVRNTNSSGNYTYDIRIEIHKEKIVLIHNAHFYETPGTYATVTFDLYKE